MTTVAALCAGYGGLELGLSLACPDVETAWLAELDPHATQVLDARFGVPNLGDLTQITDPPPVDIVTAGFPCQPVSTAGRRKGTDDHRWIIEDVCRVASAAGASRLILENVTGLLTANSGDAMARVCAAMASQGFSRWEWTTLRASDVGACHRRERWFCVAHADDIGRERSGSARGRGPRPADHAGATAHADDIAAGRHTGADAGTQGQHAGRATQHSDRPADGARAAVHADDAGRERSGSARGRGPRPADHAGATAHADGDRPRGDTQQLFARLAEPHAAGSRRDDRFGFYRPAVDRWAAILGRPAPDPLTDRRLNPRFVEWMMGLPAGWVTDIIDSRAKALHILGNGVVPQQAAAAIRELTA